MFPNYYAQDDSPVDNDDIQTENEEESQEEEEAGEDFDESEDEPEDMTGPSKPRSE